MLPSPAWPEARRSASPGRRRSARCRDSRSASRCRGTRDVVDERRAERLEAGSHQPAGLEQQLGLLRRRRPRPPRRRRARCRSARSPHVVGGPLPAVGLREQHAADVLGQPHVAVGLVARAVSRVDELQQRGLHARRTSRRAAARSASRGSRNVAATVSAGSGAGRSASVTSVIDAQRALAADEEPGQVVARDALDGAPAGAQHLPGGEHHLETEHEVGGDAVLHAAQAAGVGGDVAADRATLPRRRVGRVEQARAPRPPGRGRR